MQGIDVLHAVAILAAALLVIRVGQALLDHYAAGSAPAVASHFLFGGP